VNGWIFDSKNFASIRRALKQSHFAVRAEHLEELFGRVFAQMVWPIATRTRPIRRGKGHPLASNPTQLGKKEGRVFYMLDDFDAYHHGVALALY